MSTHPVPSYEAPNIYRQAFDRWKFVYDQLVSAMDNFLAECANLDSVLQQPGAGGWLELDAALAYVDTTVSLLEAHPRICSARAILGAIRNRSRSLVPLNNLPAELVVYIMSFVNHDCTIDHESEISTGELQPIPPLANALVVNKPLRDLLVGTPSLWTHIDLFVTGPHEETYTRYARSCLQYSEQSHLHVHIVEDESFDSLETAGLVGFLRPHTHRIVSLYLQLAVSLQRKILLGLFEDTNSSQVERLCLVDYSPKIDRDFCSRLFDGRLDGFLQPLRAFAVCGPLISLESPVYRGLTALKLVSHIRGNRNPTLLQLANALAACPELRVLTLIHWVFETIPGVSIQPAFLPNLELLDLRLAETDELLNIVSCITLGSNAIAFNMSFDPDTSELEMASLEDFLKYSMITRLCIDHRHYGGGLNWVFRFSAGVLASVQELALHGFDLMQHPVWRPLDAERFPALHTLHLLACQLDVNTCLQILDSSAVRVLQVDRTSHVKDLPGVVPFVGYRTYSDLCEGESDLEWPISLM